MAKNSISVFDGYGDYSQSLRRKYFWRRVLSILCCVAVFVTTYALILPAITLEATPDVYCGYIEHTHVASCYADPGEEPRTLCDCEAVKNLHRHTEDCYDGEGRLICGYADYLLHTHNEYCFNEAGELICPLGESDPHIHTDACGYGEGLCEREGVSLHTHSASCYDENGALVCGKIELRAHQHTEACRSKTEGRPPRDLICTIPEHTHTAACFERSTVPASVFSYEDDEMSMLLHVKSDEKLGKGYSLDVTVPTDADTEYAASESYLEEKGVEKSNLLLRKLELKKGNQTVDCSDLLMVAEVSLKSAAIREVEQYVAESVDKGIDISLLQSEQSTVTPLATVTMEASAAIPTVYAEVSDGIIALAAGDTANPGFNVQYYAYMNTIQGVDTAVVDNINNLPASTIPGTSLPFVNTHTGSGAKLPVNGTNLGVGLKYVGLNPTGGGAYQLNSDVQLMAIYSQKNYTYAAAPNLDYFNILKESASSDLAALWILKEGRNPESTDSNDWYVYENPSELEFTNQEPEQGSSNVIQIKQGMVLRLVYGATTANYSVPTTFYDYDISSGEWYSNASYTSQHQSVPASRNSAVYLKTAQQGINSASNYATAGAKFAFGNANTGTGLDNQQFGNNYFNKANQSGTWPNTTPKSYGKCSFGLVTGLDADGNIVFADGIAAPDLFGLSSDGTAGKTVYDGVYSLNFARYGNTYTLSSVRKGNETVIDGLGNFQNPQSIYTNIFTNNFWPMDTADSSNKLGHDPMFGIDADPRKSSSGESLPKSDDLKDHNSYFAMHYDVEFTLDSDYVGPLEYYFYGDDDMWVFLDGQLVCDIGGVHSSVGAYVNLWDYMRNEDNTPKSGRHTLKFYYIERGASGSTCFMQYTLPSVTVRSIQDTETLTVGKEVEGPYASATLDFNYSLTLSDVNGNALVDNYSATKYRRGVGGDPVKVEDMIVRNGSSFTLKDDEYIEIYYLPVGSRYTVTEDESPGYRAQFGIGSGSELSDGRVATGTIGKVPDGTTESPNQVRYKNSTKVYSLDIEKNVLSGSSDGQKFRFEIAFDYTGTIAEGLSDPGLIHTGAFTLGQGEHCAFPSIPEGTRVTVTEVGHEGYTVQFCYRDSNGYLQVIKAGESYTVEQISQNLELIVRNSAGYKLPDTGDSGTGLLAVVGLTLSALSLMGLILVFGYVREREL